MALKNAVCFRSDESGELVRAWRDIIASDSHASWGTNAKREQGHRDSAIAAVGCNLAVRSAGKPRELCLDRSGFCVIARLQCGDGNAGRGGTSQERLANASDEHSGIVIVGARRDEPARARARLGPAMASQGACDKPRLTKPCLVACGRKTNADLSR